MPEDGVGEGMVVVLREGGGAVEGEFAVEEGEEKREDKEDEGGRGILCEWAYGLGLVVMESRILGNIQGIFC